MTADDIREFRRGRKLDQWEFARLLGYSVHTVRSVEQGHLKCSEKMRCKIVALASGQDMREIIELRVRRFRVELYRRFGMRLPPDG